MVVERSVKPSFQTDALMVPPVSGNSAIILQLLKLIMLEKSVLTILELNWNQRLGNKKTKLSICHHMLTSSTQLQNSSFHVVERTRTSTKCQKIKNARAKRARILFFIVKYANLWGFCCRRRRGCLSSLIISELFHPIVWLAAASSVIYHNDPVQNLQTLGIGWGFFVLDSVRKCLYLHMFYFYY